MTTDMSNKSAVLPDCMMPDGADPCIGYQQLARRLEEAQQQLELYAAEMSAAREAGFYSAQELWSAYQTVQQRNAAHDAKVAAEALEEAREIFGNEWIKRVLSQTAAEYRAKATEAGRKE